MPAADAAYNVYLEVGQKKVFAVALDWPGWCRSDKDEGSALQALVDYTPRYSKVAGMADLEFRIPEEPSSFNIVARLEGTSTTDFGAPDASLPNDWDPIGNQELARTKRILSACWQVFDEVAESAEERALQKGPRGGGRDLAEITDHVIAGEQSYLKRLGYNLADVEEETVGEWKNRIRNDVFRGLEAAADGQMPRKGPRGGRRWAPRFFVRRLAWHAVDHAWEIEDRIIR